MTIDERKRIEFLAGCGWSMPKIADELGRSHSTIRNGQSLMAVKTANPDLFGEYARNTIYGWIANGLFSAMHAPLLSPGRGSIVPKTEAPRCKKVIPLRFCHLANRSPCQNIRLKAKTPSSVKREQPQS